MDVAIFADAKLEEWLLNIWSSIPDDKKERYFPNLRYNDAPLSPSNQVSIEYRLSETGVPREELVFQLNDSITLELYIHNMDGRIADRRSYGNDPFPPRG